ncbi:MAG: hypothetical protein K2O56_02495 [Muribaculaceae bacterium]|nr:hypothetical protein [Muribaculaceae bacterium]
MLYSHLSKFGSPDPESGKVRCITWIIRELTAAVFIFSGFVKAIDPWGTLYKVEDYLAVMGISIWPNLVTVGVFFLCAIEFFIGVCLALGCFRRGSAIMSLALMCFMLPLTLWIAVFNPVADCGCFGDAYIISNWATFWKNVVLFAFTLWLVRYNRYCACIITPAIQWIAFIVTALFICLIELAGYLYQPLIDFRPFKTGSALAEHIDSHEPEYVFTYAKDGVSKDFTIENLPDENEGWIFVDRKPTSGEETVPEADGFHIWDGDEDVTEEVLADDEDRILLLMPDMGNVSISTTWKINSLYDWATRHGIDMIAAVSGTDAEIENWNDLSMPDYPIYTADDTAIKELARGNPAVVYVKKGIVEWKSTLRAINTDDFMADNTSADPMSFAHDNRRMLLNFSYLYLSVMALLIMASRVPAIKRLLWR